MNSFDRLIIDFVLRHFSRSYYFFHTIEFMAADNLLKGGVVAVIFWYLWFKGGPDNPAKRVQLIATLISVFFVMVITLSLAGLFPFRERPFLNPNFNFNSLIPFNEPLTKLSSFPSDHAALIYFACNRFLFCITKDWYHNNVFCFYLSYVPQIVLRVSLSDRRSCRHCYWSFFYSFLYSFGCCKEYYFKNDSAFLNKLSWVFLCLFIYSYLPDC